MRQKKDKKAVAKLGSQVDELYQKSVDYLKHWDLEEAEQALHELLELNPGHGRALNKLGVVYARRKQLNQAEQFFKQAIAAEPKLASPHSNLGNIYQERGWLDRAKSAYEQALFLDPGHPSATHNLGVLYRKMGEIGRGVDLIKQAAKAQRGRLRDELRDSPQGRRNARLGWVVLLILGILLIFYLNR